MPRKVTVELDILFAPRRVFRKRQVMHVDAKAGRAACIWVADGDEALLPPRGENGGHGRDAVRHMKRRKLSNGGVNLVGAFGMVARIDVGFD
jgi:hypothetical protein